MASGLTTNGKVRNHESFFEYIMKRKIENTSNLKNSTGCYHIYDVNKS